MKAFVPIAASILTTSFIFLGGCAASPEHRMNVAEARDDTRRAEFEHCRDQGRSDCDAILNAPVNSNSPRSGDSVREQERRAAYNRCIDRGGSNCDDLLNR